MRELYKRKIIEYFKRNLRKGYPLATLQVALIKQGYFRAIVENSAKEAVRELAEEAPVLKEKPNIQHEVVVDDNSVPVKKSFFKKLTRIFRA